MKYIAGNAAICEATCREVLNEVRLATARWLEDADASRTPQCREEVCVDLPLHVEQLFFVDCIVHHRRIGGGVKSYRQQWDPDLSKREYANCSCPMLKEVVP